MLNHIAPFGKAGCDLNYIASGQQPRGQVFPPAPGPRRLRKPAGEAGDTLRRGQAYLGSYSTEPVGVAAAVASNTARSHGIQCADHIGEITEMVKRNGNGAWIAPFFCRYGHNPATTRPHAMTCGAQSG